MTYDKRTADHMAIAKAAGWDIRPDYENYVEVPGELSIRHEDQTFNDSSYAPTAEGWAECCEENGLV